MTMLSTAICLADQRQVSFKVIEDPLQAGQRGSLYHFDVAIHGSIYTRAFEVPLNKLPLSISETLRYQILAYQDIRSEFLSEELLMSRIDNSRKSPETIENDVSWCEKNEFTLDAMLENSLSL